MSKINKFLGILNLILWTGLFISLFFVNYNANALKDFAIGATFVIVVDIFLDMIGNRDKRIKRKVILEYMENELKEVNKQ